MFYQVSNGGPERVRTYDLYIRRPTYVFKNALDSNTLIAKGAISPRNDPAFEIKQVLELAVRCISLCSAGAPQDLDALKNEFQKLTALLSKKEGST